MTQPMVSPQRIGGLSADLNDVLQPMLERMQWKAPRVRVRRRYYDYKATLKDLGISVPPSLRSIETVLGWPAKGVDALTRRTVLTGFRDGSGAVADFGLESVWESNRLDSVLPMAFTSAAVSSPAFLFVTVADDGSPLVSAKSAEWATGSWDARSGSLSSALSVVSTDDSGAITEMHLYVPNLTVMMRRDDRSQRWSIDYVEHDLGVPVEPLVYRPTLERPFGSSRISRAAMALTDSAVRTLVRSEVSAEFFSAPQRYVLGADESSFVDKDGNAIPAWSSLIGRMMAMGRDENGDLPQVGQFTQQSMEPHLAQIRQLASLFAAEMSMTPRSFGIMQDNPESADAIQAAKEDLVMDARAWQRDLSPALKRTVVRALRLVDDSAVANAEYAKLKPHWMNPATPSVVSSADAFSKVVASVPSLASTRGGLEMLGFDEAMVDEQLSAQQRAAGAGVLAQLVNRQAQ